MNNLRYGFSETYKYELDKERMEWLTKKTNRSVNQTQFLFQLVDGDFEKLKFLEMQIKNCFYHACPSNKEEVEKLLNMTAKSKLLEL